VSKCVLDQPNEGTSEKARNGIASPWQENRHQQRQIEDGKKGKLRGRKLAEKAPAMARPPSPARETGKLRLVRRCVSNGQLVGVVFAGGRGSCGATVFGGKIAVAGRGHSPGAETLPRLAGFVAACSKRRSSRRSCGFVVSLSLASA